MAFGFDLSQEVVFGLWIELSILKLFVWDCRVVPFVYAVLLVWLEHPLEEILLVPALLRELNWVDMIGTHVLVERALLPTDALLLRRCVVYIVR